MILEPSIGPAGGWRDALGARLAAALGDRDPGPDAGEAVAGAASFLAERMGAGAVRDDELDALLGEALCAAGRADLAVALVRGAAADERARAALAPGAPPAFRRALLRGWLRPARGATRAGEVWTLDVRRVYRDAAGGLELVRLRLLAAALDALAEGLPPARGLDALALRAPAGRGRRAAARRAELQAFCAARLTEAARRRAWPRPPEIVRADLDG